MVWFLVFDFSLWSYLYVKFISNLVLGCGMRIEVFIVNFIFC